MDIERIYMAGYAKGHMDGLKSGIIAGVGLTLTCIVARMFRNEYRKATQND